MPVPMPVYDFFLLVICKSCQEFAQCERLSTQPWGTPVMSTNLEEMWLPIQIVKGLFVRESKIQLQGVLVKPREFCFPISFKCENDRISTALLSHVDVNVTSLDSRNSRLCSV